MGETEYPLAHLDRFQVIVPAKDPLAAPATLEVTFSHHVFSEKWDDSRHIDAHAFTADGEKRAFCPVRYGCSIGLRAIVEYHIGGKAFQSRDGNGVLSYLFYAEAEGIAYPAFFRLRKASRIPGVDGILHVISAYQNPDLPARHRLQSIKFARLVHQTCPPAIAK
ncbi:hypothetical protein [Sphingomonas sp. Leaf33]|uniref:hypothetical protein n=1 Tax=Sphingomonas sp. Leaf33 TaxID=1736215 RepID=UPI0012E17C93|nr:hypothetical protein [Sphingomonas sp. Leaf33]